MLKTWKILDRGDVPDPAPREADYTCLKCGRSAALPVVGIPVAQVEEGLVFDPGPHAVPKLIQCRKCRSSLELVG